jgi:head-tail adaptor
MSVGLLDQRVEILRRSVTGKDSTNDDVVAFPASETVDASVQPASQSELQAGRDTAIGDWNIFLPPGTVVEAYDRIRWGDITFEVIGPPVTWSSLAGPDHVQLTARWVQ